MVTTVLFQFSLSSSKSNEHRALRDAEHNEPLIGNQPKKNFFKTLVFYQNAPLYVFARMFMTIALVYMPLWLNEKPANGEADHSIEQIATVPLVSFIASFFASVVFKQTNRFIGHKVFYLIGCLIGMIGCVWVALTPSPSVLQLYLISIFYGAGHSLLVIASLSITADMIGTHTDQSGAVYSAVSLFDKLLTGIAIFIIAQL